MNPGIGKRLVAGLILVGLLWPAADALDFSAAERAIIAGFGPWPPTMRSDDSNRLSGNPAAISFGEALFFDHALGGDSKLSCASCHDPGRAFTDGRAVGIGRSVLQRNTTSLLNLAGNRWFGWGGEADSLWAQSIRPMLEPAEMASSPAAIAEIVQQNDRYRRSYVELLGINPDDAADESILVNVAKALAAYQETLVSPRTAFDQFRDALLANDVAGTTAYPEAAQRGLKFFVGEGRCFFCHAGPKFSNGEFGDIGMPFFVADGTDAGRYQGVKEVKRSRYNRLGEFNDGDPATNATAVRYLRLLHRNYGEFRVPGLRSLTETAPYMHGGSLPDLRAVVRHYSELDEERLHADGEKILRPLRLSERQIDDLVAFLESLDP